MLLGLGATALMRVADATPEIFWLPAGAKELRIEHPSSTSLLADDEAKESCDNGNGQNSYYCPCHAKDGEKHSEQVQSARSTALTASESIRIRNSKADLLLVDGEYDALSNDDRVLLPKTEVVRALLETLEIARMVGNKTARVGIEERWSGTVFTPANHHPDPIRGLFGVVGNGVHEKIFPRKLAARPAHDGRANVLRETLNGHYLAYADGVGELDGQIRFLVELTIKPLKRVRSRRVHCPRPDQFQ